MKRKRILGSFFKTVERDDADLLKVINKRVKLEQQRIENENQLRIQSEALANQNNEMKNTDHISTTDQPISNVSSSIAVS